MLCPVMPSLIYILLFLFGESHCIAKLDGLHDGRYNYPKVIVHLLLLRPVNSYFTTINL